MTDTPATEAKPAAHRLYLIDGSGYIFRAYHALPPLTRKSDGLPIGAVAGFCNMINRLLEQARQAGQATHMAVVFDPKGGTFRNELYDLYKANRSEPPEDLVPQFPLMRDATRAFGLPCLEREGFEADDVIATLARQGVAAGMEVVVISSDKDLMQLVGNGVRLHDPMKDKPIGEPEVREKFGVAPERVVDVQALAGDSSDNVPGVPGIGVKTAAELINTYGNLETLLERAAEIKQPKRRESLIAHADKARLSKQLVTLRDDVPLDVDLDALTLHPPVAATILAFCDLMEFSTLRRRIESQFGAAAVVESRPELPVQATAETVEAVTQNYALVLDETALQGWIARARATGLVAVDTETTSLEPMKATLVGISLSTAPGEACYIPVNHVDDFGQRVQPQLDAATAVGLLQDMLADPAILKVGQNLKYDMVMLGRHGAVVAPYDDTMLISYVLDGGRHGHGMDELARLHLDHQCISYDSVTGTGKARITFDRVPMDKALAYAAEDADITLRLHRVLKPRLLAERLTGLYETIERPLAGVIAGMEAAGIVVDRDALIRLSTDFAQRMAELERRAHELAGETFNLGSPKQLGEILFDKMSLAGAKKTKTGAYGTAADVLETLAAQGHELPKVILDWRQLSKLKGTYTDALRDAMSPETGRVHTSYALAATSTGRLSSSDPNLQNIPIRTEEGRKIRNAFVAAPGHLLLSADYSQIELRLLAHIADIAALKDAFAAGIDIHALTASQVFDVPIEGMDAMVRRRAKAINFGIIYGMSAFGLSQQLGIPQREAAGFIDAYFQRFPGIRAYMDRTKTEAHENGFVSTIFGRRCWLSGINSKNPAERAFQERAAINAPIQGSAADIIKRAMNRLPRALARAGLKARMLLQVHDELVFELPEGEAGETAALVKSVMEGAAALSVPLTVETGLARDWGAAH
ncbi:MAG: DNA polymerase I [Alphaproteobacteria bacterium]|jgi:DNA polymerase-1|nr:DNA polymerase I [Alphaproteobacteria bacterium]